MSWGLSELEGLHTFILWGAGGGVLCGLARTSEDMRTSPSTKREATLLFPWAPP